MNPRIFILVNEDIYFLRLIANKASKVFNTHVDREWQEQEKPNGLGIFRMKI
ncbi:hypothetical protein MED222_10728 [Vibrio sp. MED222]|nr:hypothetical protein MED222_10728 [Vibrio sp. MED222]